MRPLMAGNALARSPGAFGLRAPVRFADTAASCRLAAGTGGAPLVALRRPVWRCRSDVRDHRCPCLLDGGYVALAGCVGWWRTRAAGDRPRFCHVSVSPGGCRAVLRQGGPGVRRVRNVRVHAWRLWLRVARTVGVSCRCFRCTRRSRRLPGRSLRRDGVVVPAALQSQPDAGVRWWRQVNLTRAFRTPLGNP